METILRSQNAAPDLVHNIRGSSTGSGACGRQSSITSWANTWLQPSRGEVEGAKRTAPDPLWNTPTPPETESWDFRQERSATLCISRALVYEAKPSVPAGCHLYLQAQELRANSGYPRERVQVCNIHKEWKMHDFIWATLGQKASIFRNRRAFWSSTAWGIIPSNDKAVTQQLLNF